MAQLSRPYQIALAAIALFGLVWVVALHGHASNPSEPAPSAPAASSPSPSSSSGAKDAAKPTSVYHGAAPGVEGLTRAIAKAHEAVGTSQQNAQQLAQKSASASDEAQPSAGASSPASRTPNSATHTASAAPTRSHTSARRHTRAGHGATGTHETSASARRAGSSPASKSSGGHPSEQRTVEREVSHGKTVMLLFWNPKSTVDDEVRAEAKALATRSKGSVTLHTAHANQVGLFGSITEVAHVYQTPTILIVNRKGIVSTFTGLTDVFALQQAVREARNASA